MAAPDGDEPHRPSLVGRALTVGIRSGRRLAPTLRSALASPRPPAGTLRRLRDWLTPVRLAIAVPALTLGGGVCAAVTAQLVADSHHRAIAALAPRARPVLNARALDRARAEAWAADRPLYERGSIGAVLERLARDLPPEAQLASIARDEKGAIRLSVLTPDPDRLLRSASLAGLSALDQRRDDSGRILVLLQGRGG